MIISTSWRGPSIILPRRRKMRAPNLSRIIRKLASLATFSLLGLAGTACVTVNVNLPESAVQKASDDYVRDLYRSREKGPKSPASETSPAPVKASWLRELSLLPAAYADASSGTVEVKGAKTEEIRGRLLSRLDDVIANKRQGVLGESNDG